MTNFIKESPFESHRQLYLKNLLVYGGFYEGAIMPNEVKEKILAGRAITLLTDDGTASTKHIFSKSKEIIKMSLDGYYLRLGLPLKRELMTAIRRFEDFGIIHEVF